MKKPSVWGTNINWHVGTYDTVTIHPDGDMPDPHHLALLRDDCKHRLGYVSDHYEIVQNNTLFSLLQPLVDENLAEISFQGYMRYGKIVLVQARLNTGFEIGDLEHNNFVTISNTHAGKGNLEIGVGNIRMCCLNQYQANKKSLTNKSVFSHRIGVNDQLNLDMVLEFVAKEQKRYQDKIHKLTKHPIKHHDLRVIIEDVFGAQKHDKIYNNIVRLFRHGVGNNGKTAYDLFSATTDFISNHSKNDKNYSIANAIVGSGASQSHKMLENLLALV